MIDRRTSHPMKAEDKNLKATIAPRWRLAPMALGLMVLTTTPAWSLPVDPTLVAGSATISQPRANALLVNQSSQSARIDWRSFDVADGERVQFVQPNANSVIFNKVLSSDPSSIFGTISANGRVFLINPAGVIFGPTAVVDTGSLVATALDVRLDPANPDRFSLVTTTDHPGRIENQGRLSAAHGGVVALIGGQVVNSGSILTPGGTTALVVAARVTLDFAGDKLLSFEVDPALARASIQHSGRIEAEGGDAVFEVRARDALLDTVLNVEGVVRANRLVERNGTIHIDGGDSGVVRIGAQLDASGSRTAGGLIEVTGDKVLLDAGARLIASGASGGGSIHVGGDWQGSGPLHNASMTQVAAGARLEADAIESGNGGEVVVWSNESTRFFGHAQAQGGPQGGDGGRGEISGKGYLDFRGTFSASAPQGKAGMLLLDPLDITISNAEMNNVEQDEEDGAFVPSGDSSVLPWQRLKTVLETSDVIVTTARSNGAQSGDITVAESSGDLQSGRSLTLETADGGKININASITNTGGGSLIYDGPVTLGADTTLSGTNVSLRSTVDGAYSLTINDGGTTTFGGVVGGTTALASLSTNAGGTTVIKGGEVRSTGAQTYGDNLAIANAYARLSTLGGAVTVAGATTLSKGLTVSSGAGDATFNGTVDGPGALAVNSSGTTTFSKAVGGSTDQTRLASLTTDALGQTLIEGGSVTTSGEQSYGDEVKLSVDTTLKGSTVTTKGTLEGSNKSLTIDGDAVLGGTLSGLNTLTVSKSTTIQSGTVTSSGMQKYLGDVTIEGTGAQLNTKDNAVTIDGALTLSKGLKVSSGAGDATFNGIVDGPGTLVVNSGGKTIFSKAVSGSTDQTRLASLTTDAGGSTVINGGAVRTSGEQSYGDEVTLSVDTTLKGSTVRSKGTLAGGSKSLTIEGNAVLGNTVSDLNSLTVTGTTKLDIGNLVTVGEQSYGGAVTLGADTTLAGSTVKMLGGVTGREHPLSIVGDAVLGGTSSGLTTLTVSKSTTITGGEVRSTGAQTYGDNLVIHNADASLSTLGGAVMVAGATTLSKRLTVSSGAGDVSFSGRIDGPGELEVNSSGITTFSQAVGAGTALASLTTDALGQTLIEGGSVKTSGEQSYGDAVTLSVDTTLKGSTVRSKGTLAGGSKSLTIEGNAVLGNTVSDLNSLTVTGTTKLDIGNLVTVGEQSYGGGVTLGTDTTLTGSTVKMLKGGTGVEHALSIFGDAVLGGTLSGLTTLTVSKSTTITGRTVTSSGKQEYLGDATIAGATTLSSGAGDVTFHGKVFGPSSLSLNSQGTVTFNDAVGGFNDAVHADTPLASLTTDAGGKLLINGGLVRTTGRQSYADRVELGGDTTLHVSASDARILTVKGEDGFSLAYYDNAVELREGGSITNQSGSRLKVVVDGPGSVDLLGLKPKDGSSTTPSLAELVTKAAETLDPSSTAFAGLIGWTTRNDLQGEVTVITDVANGGAHSSDAQHLVGIAAPKIEIAKFGGYDERADIGVLADSVLLMTRALPISRLDGMVDNGIVKATASLPAEAVAHHPYVPALTMLPVDDGRIGASQPYYYGGADKDSWIPVELGVDARQQGLVVFLPPRDAGREASSLFLGGPKELKPIQTGSSSVSYRSYSLPVIYNGEIISSAQFAGFEASLVQLLSDIRREQLERGYANESIPARLRTGVVMETGLGSPAVDEFEGVALPARCTGTVSASGMSCAN